MLYSSEISVHNVTKRLELQLNSSSIFAEIVYRNKVNLTPLNALKISALEVSNAELYDREYYVGELHTNFGIIYFSIRYTTLNERSNAIRVAISLSRI